MKNDTFNKVIIFIISVITFWAHPFYAVTRDQVISIAQSYINIMSWSPINDRYDFVQGDPFYTFYSQYKTQIDGGYSFFYPNYPLSGQYVSGPPYPIIAYVYGGYDNAALYQNRIYSGVCPGGYNTSKWYLPLIEGGFGFAQEVPGHLAGIDCSGYVTNCWGMYGHPYSTSTFKDICLEIEDEQLKKGDILNNPGKHVVLFYSGNFDSDIIVYESQSVEGIPPGVISHSTVSSRYYDYGSYSIFPQFTVVYPPIDTTINQGTINIELKAEGTRPINKPKMKVTAEISNIQMWLDDSLVTHSNSGPKDSQTIKYKTDSLAPGKHNVKVKCFNVVNGIAYEDTVRWEFRINDDRPGWLSCKDNSNDIPEYNIRVTIDPPTEFITPMDSLTTSEHLFYTEMSDTIWTWNGTLQNVSELKSLSISGICPLSIYKVQLPNEVIYTGESRSWYSEPVSWPSVEILVDGVALPVTFSKAKFLWLYEWYDDYDTTYVFWLKNINWYASDAGIKNPQIVTVKVKPTVIVDPVNDHGGTWERVGMNVFNYPPDMIGSYFTQFIRQPCMVCYDGDGALIPYIGDSTTTAALVSDGKVEKTGGKLKQTDNLACFIVNDIYPNPVRNFATMKFTIPQAEKIELKIYNLTGQLVKTLINDNKPAGIHQTQWDCRDEKGQKVSQGVYLYRITAGSFSDTKKLILLR